MLSSFAPLRLRSTQPSDSAQLTSTVATAPVILRAAQCVLTSLITGLTSLLAVAVALTMPATVHAQSCGLSNWPDFSGHSLPLESVPELGAMTLVNAYPNLPGLSNLTTLTSPNDGSNRIFVTTQAGQIYFFQDDPFASSVTLFADFSSIVTFDQSEQGLLGLAFDPDYATNRRFYINYAAMDPTCGVTGNDGCTQIARYEASASDPNQADLGTRQLVLEFPQPGSFHNGGTLAFGPDGMLYISTGDGGGSGAGPNSQDLSSLLGAILRVDVRDSAPSLIPTDNPFVGTPGARGEVFAYGLRNPWRISFDRVTGDLWIGDVGAEGMEEIDFIDASSGGGQNFGWPLCEGTQNFNGSCNDVGLEPPILSYAHNGSSASVTGGFVYRGPSLPELVGAYVYSDPFFQTVWAWDRAPGSQPEVIATDGNFIVAWGEAPDGELLGLAYAGGIYRFERNGPPTGGTSVFPTFLSETGLFQDTAALTPAAGLIPYDVTDPLWSDSSEKRRWIALPAGHKIGFKAEGEWDFPVGTALVKHFELNIPSTGGLRRIETRVFVRQLTDWAGVTYRWNAAGNDAVLLTDGLVEGIDLGQGIIQNWNYPSTAECLGCHSTAAGRVLGAQTNQLNKTFDYGPLIQNQLAALSCGALFDHLIQDPTRYDSKANILDTSTDLTLRMRSYMDTNCGVCHQPFGAGRGTLDLRFEVPVNSWNAIGVDPEFNDLGLPSAQLITPGDPVQSIFWQRQIQTDSGLRMARGTLAPDFSGVNAQFSWIQSGLGTIDSDGDGITDTNDFCPTIADPLQLDQDFDGIGDACDPDTQADLRVSDHFLPTNANEGANVFLLGFATNDGPSVSESFPVTFHLSEDASFDPAFDRPIGACWLSPLDTGEGDACIAPGASIPLDLLADGETSRTFTWVVCANRSGVAPDGNPSNACEVTGKTVTVPEPGLGAALGGLVWFGAAHAALRRRRGRAGDGVQRP